MAGRIDIQTLWPLSQGEIQGNKESWIDNLFSSRFEPTTKTTSLNLQEKLITGGYPEVVLRDPNRREAWFKNYLNTILQRDISLLSNIEGLSYVPDLLMLIASRIGGLVNISDLGRSLGLPRSTLVRYITLLESIFLLIVLQPWHTNISNQIVKSPKFYLNDSGILAHLLGVKTTSLSSNSQLTGKLLENFVLMELIKQTGWNRERIRIFHFRTRTNEVVDFVLESADGRIVGIEVKAASSVDIKSTRGLSTLKSKAESRFLRGIILYTGKDFLAFEKDMFLVPLQALWT